MHTQQHDTILILDFGSQYTQLIGRKIRELNVYSEIIPFYADIDTLIKQPHIKGVIFSGSPASVHNADAPKPNIDVHNITIPVLGVCYGAQYLAQINGGKVEKSEIREYGRAHLELTQKSPLLNRISNHSVVWMSHADTITELPSAAHAIAKTESIPYAAFHMERNIYGIQFHPEVYHTEQGNILLENFCKNICGCVASFTPNHYITEVVEGLKQQLKDDKVVMALSGGVDSTVAAKLIQKAIGNNLYCIFVDNGLLRQNEWKEVLNSYQDLGLQIIPIDAKEKFYMGLKGLTDPEAKRKAIGRMFIEVFDEEAHKLKEVKWLGQGTIYPDVIESVSVKGPSATIKSHHNVGGLPEKMNMKVVEPLSALFKDEVRRVGKELGLSDNLLGRHPFPGPGLGIRILGEVNADSVNLLQSADSIYIEELKSNGLYNKIWQAGAILLPIHSVGVMGDERTYEKVVALRAVSSTDGMTADWYHIPYDVLAKISNRIINEVKGINRVVYDISSKPPATIEWE